MTTTTVQMVVAAAEQLSPIEQLEVIQALTNILHQRYRQINTRPALITSATIDVPKLSTEAQPGKQMAEILGRLAQINAFTDIADAAAWERNIREDRALLDREG